MKKYYVETWKDEKELAVFDTEEERKNWFKENCYMTDHGGFLKETNERIAFYEF